MLIVERLPNVQFIQSIRKNKPDSIVPPPKAVSKAMELWSALIEDFENPQLLQFFLSQLLFGHHVMKVSGIRNEEVDKTVDVACHFLVQNTRSNRQVKHQPKKNDGFRHTGQTPLSIGLPLAIHSCARNKTLVNNLTDVYVGSDYQQIIDLEKRVEHGVFLRMKETGDIFLIFQKITKEEVMIIGDYEMSVVPGSLVTVDESLYIPTDKASLMNAVGAKTESAPVPDIAMADCPIRVARVLVDAMALLQCMKKTPTMRKISDLSEVFIKPIEGLMVVFDRYTDQSLKIQTRQKRAVTSTEYDKHSEMKLAMSLKELLSASRTKSSLTAMLTEGLLKYYSRNSTSKLVVVCGTEIKGHDFEENHAHEEADTMIHNQVLASLADIKLADWFSSPLFKQTKHR